MQMLQTSRKSQQGPTILLLKWGEKGAFNSKGGDRSPNTAARSPGSCDRKPGGPAQRWGAQPPSGSQQESESHRDRGPGGLGQTINQCWLTLKNGRNANSKSPRHVSAFVDTSFLLLKPRFCGCRWCGQRTGHWGLLARAPAAAWIRFSHRDNALPEVAGGTVPSCQITTMSKHFCGDTLSESLPGARSTLS